MNLKEWVKWAGKEFWDNSVLYFFVGMAVLLFALFIFWLRGEVHEGHVAAQERRAAYAQRENWCYERGYFEVVELEKLQKGYMCVDARETDLIRTLIIPKEISERGMPL